MKKDEKNEKWASVFVLVPKSSRMFPHINKCDILNEGPDVQN